MWPELGQQPPSEPYGWWGYHWRAPEPRSIVALLADRVLDARTAALLWLLLERRASLVVVAPGSDAGKTTLLTALLDFLPPGVRRIYLRGWSETFDFPADAAPARSYLLCNEISAHLPVYLWGCQVRRLFTMLEQGYALAATLHAGGLDEAIATLTAPPLAVPRRAVARLDLLLLLDGDATGRRVRTLDYLHDARGTGELAPTTLVRWDSASQTFRHREHPPAGLLERTGQEPAALLAELHRRARFLTDLAARGRAARDEVRAALGEWYTTITLGTRAGTTAPAGDHSERFHPPPYRSPRA